MRDALFGDIEYEFGWVGQCTWPFFGNRVLTRLVIPCEESEEISLIQREAFAAFEQNKAAMCKVAEDAIVAYYSEKRPELIERFGSQFADQWAPEIEKAESMSRLVAPTEVIIQESFVGPPERVVGLLFDCTWERSLGLAVKFVDERFNAVGTQDIVI